MSSFNQRGCFGCGGAENSFVYDSNPNSFNDPLNFFNHPPQPQTYSCELCGNDSHYGFDCPPRVPLINIIKSLQAVYEKLNQQEQAANLSTHTPEPSRRFNFIYDDDDDDEERTIPLNEIISQIPASFAITPVLPTMEPKDSLIIGDENLSTIPEKESDKFIKSSVEKIVPIPSESEDTFDNDRFDDESFLEEDVQAGNFKIYLNPLFDFDDEYISSDVNPLFNEDECFDPGGDIDEIEACLTSDSISPEINDADFDPDGDIIYLESLLIKYTTHNLPSDVFLDIDPKSLNDEPDFDDLKNNPEMEGLMGLYQLVFNKLELVDKLLRALNSPCLEQRTIDDESFLEEDVQAGNFKIYLNPLFDFDDEYISSDVNPLFNEVLEDIESKDSYVSKLDEPALLVTPLSDTNEDECFDPRGDIDEIEACLTSDSISLEIDDADFDPEGDIIYLESLLIKYTTHNLPSEVFLDIDPKCLNDEPDFDDLKSMVKVFDPGDHVIIFFSNICELPFEDRHYFSFMFAIRIFLPYLTYSVNSPFLLSSGSEDTIFDPGISAFSFYSLEPVVSHQSGTFMCFNVYLYI
ncbi:hypothetical protein Tco_0446291 [Tanacetum coccineum]